VTPPRLRVKSYYYFYYISSFRVEGPESWIKKNETDPVNIKYHMTKGRAKGGLIGRTIAEKKN